jgi:hypothetical protein
MASPRRVYQCRHAATERSELRWLRCSSAGWRMQRGQHPVKENTRLVRSSFNPSNRSATHLWIFQFGVGIDASVAHATVQAIHYHGKFHWDPGKYFIKSPVSRDTRVKRYLHAFKGRGTPPTNTVLRGSNDMEASNTKSASDKRHGRI